LLRRHEIRVLSHSGHLGPHADIPALGWIPDFQHLKLPEFFTVQEVNARTRIFRDCCRYCSLVIVSSLAAAGDLGSLDATCANKVRCLPFVADVPDSATLPSLRELEAKYRLEGPYVLLPAQFWAHKNHLVVIEALSRLKAKGCRIPVLATGSTADYRQPEHFARLMTRVRGLRLEGEFRVLGVVPYRDVMGLMLHAAAVANPSFFEGWSTAVEEAKSLGKRLILSDIPVHREQAPGRAEFFAPQDTEALARLLAEAVEHIDRSEEEHHAQQARHALRARQALFANRFEEIVAEAITLGEPRRGTTGTKAPRST
jgi:glycosyltransferase involved in cell wall biosynthesis